MTADEEHRPDTVGLRIAKLVREQGVTLKEIEKVSGLDRGTVAKLVGGNQKSTSLEAGLKIARRLGVDPYSLIPGEPTRLVIEGEVGLRPQDVGRMASLQATLESLTAGMGTMQAQIDRIESRVKQGRPASPASSKPKRRPKRNTA